MFEDLLGSKISSKIDLINAFLQIPLTETSKPVTTIYTSWGLYAHNFLPFGLSVSPSVSTTSGIDGVKAYQDDLIVFGSTTEDHHWRLTTLL